jgi:hypothetical protein
MRMSSLYFFSPHRRYVVCCLPGEQEHTHYAGLSLDVCGTWEPDYDDAAAARLNKIAGNENRRLPNLLSCSNAMCV